MIQAAQDFASSIEFLSSDFSADIRQMAGTLSSADFNATWQYVEYELDLLYEKTRVLEDCIGYVKKTLNEDIQKRQAQLSEKMKTIEGHADSYLNHSFVAKSVSLTGGTGGTDRDGSYLPAADVVCGQLCLPTALVQSYQNNTCVRSGERLPYRSAPEQLLLQEPYRSFYILGQPASDCVAETLRCTFAQPVTVSRITAKPINCYMTSLIVFTDSGKAIPVPPNQDFSPIAITAMEVRLLSDQPSLCQFLQVAVSPSKTDLLTEQAPQLTSTACIEDVELAGYIQQKSEQIESYYQQLTIWKSDNERIKQLNLRLAKGEAMQ